MADLKVEYWNDAILEDWLGIGFSLILKVIKLDVILY
jgi:hypothetical protein